MKYSGVEWIGEIPDNWDIRKVKHCFYISKEQAHEENPTILSLARAGVKVRDISNNEGQLAASYDNYNPVMPGDLLLNPMDLYSGANCSLSDVSGVISPAYIKLRKKVELNPKFYDYYFKTQYWAMAMFAHGKGVSFDNRWTMNAETLLNYYLPLPSSDVQDKIVDLINKKTAEIDSLIEIENRQIEKLKEYKKVKINEIIQNHSNEHIKYKYVLSIKSGTSIVNSKLNNDDTYPVYGGGSLLGYHSDFNCEAGSLVIGRVGANCGCITLMKSKAWATDNALIADTSIDSEYVYYLMVSSDFNKLNDSSAQPLITGTKIKNTITPFTFKIEKQKETVKVISKLNENIDSLIVIKKDKIDKLKEYKKSLIYEYVTGKKEVIA